jgi:hypothetical protein
MSVSFDVASDNPSFLGACTMLVVPGVSCPTSVHMRCAVCVVSVLLALSYMQEPTAFKSIVFNAHTISSIAQSITNISGYHKTTQ